MNSQIMNRELFEKRLNNALEGIKESAYGEVGKILIGQFAGLNLALDWMPEEYREEYARKYLATLLGAVSAGLEDEINVFLNDRFGGQ